MNKETLFKDWNCMRFLRLGIGISIAVLAVETISLFSGIVAVFFLFQAITNIGCCETNDCALLMKKSNPKKTEKVEFEEIKQK